MENVPSIEWKLCLCLHSAQCWHMNHRHNWPILYVHGLVSLVGNYFSMTIICECSHVTYLIPQGNMNQCNFNYKSITLKANHHQNYCGTLRVSLVIWNTQLSLFMTQKIIVIPQLGFTQLSFNKWFSPWIENVFSSHNMFSLMFILLYSFQYLSTSLPNIHLFSAPP